MLNANPLEPQVSNLVKKHWRGAFWYARSQLVILGAILILHLLAHFGIIPNPTQLNQLLLIAFKNYGVPLVAVCSFFENLAVANGYFPGAFTILAGMASTAGDPQGAIVMYLAILFPAVVANFLSYWIGRAIKGNTSSLKKTSLTAFWLTYWHPQLASVTAFQAGSERGISFNRFVMMAALPIFTWSIFWALCIYWSGMVADVGRYFWTGFVLYLVCWTAIRIRDYWRKAPLS